MPNPKHRHSKTRRDMRRAHDFLKPKQTSVCPKCGADQREAPPQPSSPVLLAAARRAKRDEFADPDLFERPRDEEEPGAEAEEAVKRLDDEEELPLEGSGKLEAPESDDEEY